MHGDPEMRKTLAEVQSQYEESSPHIFSPGCKVIYSVEDVLNKGYKLMQAQNGPTFRGSDASDEVEKPDFDNVVIELF